MKLLPTAALLSVLAISPTFAQDALKFSTKLPAKGDVQRNTQKMSMDINVAIKVDGVKLQDMNMSRSR